MLHDSRARYARHVTAERCNLIRAAVSRCSRSPSRPRVRSGSSWREARRIATALYGECLPSVTAEDSTITLRLDTGGTTTLYHGQTEADAWAECMKYLTDTADRSARYNRAESERLAKKSADIAAAVAGTDSR